MINYKLHTYQLLMARDVARNPRRVSCPRISPGEFHPGDFLVPSWRFRFSNVWVYHDCCSLGYSQNQLHYPFARCRRYESEKMQKIEKFNPVCFKGRNHIRRFKKSIFFLLHKSLVRLFRSMLKKISKRNSKSFLWFEY